MRYGFFSEDLKNQDPIDQEKENPIRHLQSQFMKKRKTSKSNTKNETIESNLDCIKLSFNVSYPFFMKSSFFWGEKIKLIKDQRKKNKD